MSATKNKVCSTTGKSHPAFVCDGLWKEHSDRPSARQQEDSLLASGTPKIEQTNPMQCPFQCPKHAAPQSLAATATAPLMKPKSIIFKFAHGGPADALPELPYFKYQTRGAPPELARVGCNWLAYKVFWLFTVFHPMGY